MNAAQMVRITACIWAAKISSTPLTGKEAAHDKLQSVGHATLVPFFLVDHVDQRLAAAEAGDVVAD